MRRNRFISKKIANAPLRRANLLAATAAKAFVTAISVDSTTDSAATGLRSGATNIFRFISQKGDFAFGNGKITSP
jgi:hypothetical protein